MNESLRTAKDAIRFQIRRYTTLAASLDLIPVIDSITRQQFLSKYALYGIPVLIKSAAQNWKLSQGRLNYFKNLFPSYTCKVRVGDYSFGNKPFETVSMTIEEYVNLIRKHDLSKYQTTYAAYQIAPNNIDQYISYPKWLPTKYTTAPIHFWLGPQGTYTGIHSDTCDKLIYQCEGRKKWFLIAPQEFHKLYLYDDFGRGYDASPIDIRSVDNKKYSAFRNIYIHTIVLEPNDVFYLPGGWYHAVESLDISLSFEYKGDPVPYSVRNFNLTVKLTQKINKIRANKNFN